MGFKDRKAHKAGRDRKVPKGHRACQGPARKVLQDRKAVRVRKVQGPKVHRAHKVPKVRRASAFRDRKVPQERRGFKGLARREL